MHRDPAAAEGEGSRKGGEPEEVLVRQPRVLGGPLWIERAHRVPVARVAPAARLVGGVAEVLLLVVAEDEHEPRFPPQGQQTLDYLPRLRSAIHNVSQDDNRVLSAGGEFSEQRVERDITAVNVADRQCASGQWGHLLREPYGNSSTPGA